VPPGSRTSVLPVRPASFRFLVLWLLDSGIFTPVYIIAYLGKGSKTVVLTAISICPLGVNCVDIVRGNIAKAFVISLVIVVERHVDNTEEEGGHPR